MTTRATQSKTIDFSTWGPLTVLTVVVVLLVVIGGVVQVITGHLTFDRFLDDILKWVGGALALGTAIGRGVHLAGR